MRKKKIMCPFCRKKLNLVQCGDTMFWMCANIKCKESSGLGANLQTWIKMQEVQNKLDLAIQELKTLSQIASTLDQSESIDEVIKEITGELHD